MIPRRFCAKSKRSIGQLIAILMLQAVAGYVGRAQDPSVNSTPPVTTAQGSKAVKPAAGTGGAGTTYNFLPYINPGEFFNNKTNVIETAPFDIAYATRNQPIQTSDWWNGIGLQWGNYNQTAGWVLGRKDDEGKVGRSKAFIAEPFRMQFVDLGDHPGNNVDGIPARVHGLRFWNQNGISHRTDGKINAGDKFDASNNFAGYGNVAAEASPVVTVGLLNVHPLGVELRTQAPWSNVKVQSYSDWGARVAYTDASSQLTATLASGSPFAWLERTQGAAAFVVWVGDRDTGSRTVWYNQNGVIGVTVTTAYVPYNGVPKATSTAAYVIFADQGAWAEQAASGQQISMFTNPAATRVAVLAMPHNINPSDAAALIAAMNDLSRYACQQIVDTRLHYPPIPGSDANGEGLLLGFFEKESLIRTKLQVTTAPFQLQGCGGGVPLQLVFPHHRKAMIAASKKNILMAGGAPQYVWSSPIGELYAYAGASYVRELTNFGSLPFLPSLAINPSQPDLPGGSAGAEDIYQAMKTWFFLEEPILPGVDVDGNPTPAHLSSFTRNLGTYVNVQTNTYIQGISGLYEMLIIADQLAQSPQLSEMDADLGKSKQAVAAEMRGFILQSLKELLGQWADVYTAQFFQYNSQYNSFLGYPEGFGSVQNFNDHHFHYGYFLRAAVAVGRYDRDWLTQYMPFIDEIRRDVATYDRADTKYPFLREFSPFYGHNWADGTGQDGNNQESVSEAMNFSFGLIELGQVLGDQKLRDLGVYMLEEEILAAEQYWFNQEADLAKSSGQLYNGNWLDSLVHYTGPDGQPWKTTLVANVKQDGVFRNTFFGGVQGVYTIQQTPMSAFSLFIGRNQNWLRETWKQYLLDFGGGPSGPYEGIIAALQAQLPPSGTTINDTGLTGALARINQVHINFPGALNAMAKNWAYALAQLGQIDTGVVADTASYGVFNKNGQRSYIAYNPTGSEITATFTNRATGAKTTLNVPAFSMASKTTGASPLIDGLTPYAPEAHILYLRAAGKLDREAGQWMLPAGQSAFPGDTSALAPSLVVVPVRSDQDPTDPNNPIRTPISPPPAADIRTWTGSFSGKLVGGPTPVTRFAIHTDHSLFPGWQQDNTRSANNVTVRFLYDFDSDNQPDRIEVLQNASLNPGNSFTYQNKLTEYYLKPTFGLDDRPPIYVDPQSKPFPAEVTNGTLTVQIYGGSNPNNPQFLQPVPVSVETSRYLNRASWVKPPYEFLVATPGPLPPALAPCSLICMRAPGYYEARLGRLPSGSVLIAGVNNNTKVSTTDVDALRLALQGNAAGGGTFSPQRRFNRQFVTTQLSLLAVPGQDQAALKTQLSCYDLRFSVKLSNGATLGSASTLGDLITQATLAARSGTATDYATLGDLFDALNSDDPYLGCGASNEPAFSPAVQDQLDAALTETMTRLNIPGAVVGIWVPGEGEWVSLRGTANLATGEPMQLSNHFRIGSNTKVFTNELILQLADGPQPKLRLDDPVSKYLDFVPNGDNITLRMLGNMTSGLYSYTWDDKHFVEQLLSNPQRAWTARELVDIAFLPENAKDRPAPGTQWAYVNTNTVLLGMVIEKVTGQKIQDVMAERIFAPLGLRNTFWPTTTAMPEPYAHGITVQTPDGRQADATHNNPSWGQGAGQLISDLADLRIWGRAVGEGQLLSPQMQAERLKLVPTYPGQTGSGYGMGVGNDNGWIGHGGSLPGYTSTVFYLPSKRATIVVLTNTDIPVDKELPAPAVFRALATIIAPDNAPQN